MPCLAACSLCLHTAGTLGSLSVHGPDLLERRDSSGRVVEHFYFICFSPSLFPVGSSVSV